MKKDKENKPNKQFKIHFAGLSRGEHEYDFEVTDKFFESFEFSEIKKGKIHLKLKLNRQDLTLILNFNFSGSINLPCDRCDDAFDVPVEGNQQLVVTLGGEKSDEGDELLIIPETESEIDLTHYIYEYIILLVPQKRVHKTEKECNQDVIQKLRQFEPNKKNEVDPRWEKLKKINFQ